MTDRSEKITQKIKEGLITALSNKPYNKLKVTDIVANANISRNTFYRHYKDKDQAMNEIMDEYLDQYFAAIDDLEGPFTEERVTVIFKWAYLQALEDKQRIELMFKSGIDDIFYKKLRSFSKRICGNICRTRGIKVTNHTYFEYIVDLYSGGIFQLFKRWVDEGMVYDVDQIARLNAHLLNERFVKLLQTSAH